MKFGLALLITGLCLLLVFWVVAAATNFFNSVTYGQAILFTFGCLMATLTGFLKMRKSKGRQQTET